MFAHLFGVRPWEIDRLTLHEFEVLCSAADDHQRQIEEANRG